MDDDEECSSGFERKCTLLFLLPLILSIALGKVDLTQNGEVLDIDSCSPPTAAYLMR